MSTSDESQGILAETSSSILLTLSDNESDCDGTASDCSGDSSSTYQYSHEPWISFQDKVLQLAAQLFPDSNINDTWIQHMRGGSSNRVIGIGIPIPPAHGLLAFIKCIYHRLCETLGLSHCQITEDAAQYILRVPRWDNALMPRNMATLQFASSKLNIPVPCTLSYDMSEENALGAPYVLQRRLIGQNLQAVLPQLNLAQRIDVTRKVCKIILEMQNFTHDSCAIIAGANSDKSKYEMKLLSIPADPDKDGKFHSPPANKPMDTLGFITSTCKRWKDHESTYLRNPRPEWDQSIEMAQEMYDHGYLGLEDRFHFTHLDLYPRNILVNVVDEDSVDITGILDWDDAMFAPRFVACRAPFWLWEGEEEMDERDEYEALETPQDSDMKKIKDVFEDSVGHEFCRYAYGEVFVLLRRLFFIMRLGLGYSHHVTEIQAILSRWQELRPSHDASIV